MAIGCSCWGHLDPDPRQLWCSSRASGEAGGFQTLQADPDLSGEFSGSSWTWVLGFYFRLKQLTFEWVYCIAVHGGMALLGAQEQLGAFWLVVHLPSDYLVHSLNTSSLYTWQHAARCAWLRVQTPRRTALSCPWSSAFPFAIKAVLSGVKGNLEAALTSQNPDLHPALGLSPCHACLSCSVFSSVFSLLMEQCVVPYRERKKRLWLLNRRAVHNRGAQSLQDSMQPS